MPQYMILIQNALEQFWTQLDSLLVVLPDPLQNLIQNSTEQLRGNLSSMLLSLVQSTGSSSLTSVPNFLLGVLIALLSSYFFTKDAVLIHSLYEKYVLALFRTSIHNTKRNLKTSVWGYIKTQLILMIYTFAITFIGLMVLRSPSHCCSVSSLPSLTHCLSSAAGSSSGRSCHPSDSWFSQACHWLYGHLRRRANHAANHAAKNPRYTDWSASFADTVFHVLWI